jgi:cbb3-type cytochrome oxidase subunit 3
VSIFGAFVFPYTLQVNWAYILAVFAMVMFLIAAILFILDAVHSKRQSKYISTKQK